MDEDSVVDAELDEESVPEEALLAQPSNSMDYTAVCDVGTALNPLLLSGQIEGAIAMGIGMALQERYIQKDGITITKDLESLHVPKATDVPYEIHAIPVEEIHPYGPYGAKGMGELPLNPTAPAILNAVYNAVGVRIHKLPVDCRTIAEAIKARQGE